MSITPQPKLTEADLGHVAAGTPAREMFRRY